VSVIVIMVCCVEGTRGPEVAMTMSNARVETTNATPFVVSGATRGLTRSLAVVVSQVASPPVVAVAAAYLAAGLHGRPVAFGWATLHVVLMVLVPLIYLVGLLRRGAVSDLDVYRREERWRPFLATVAGAWTGWVLLTALGAPPSLMGVTGVLALEALVVFAITLSWKISLHCATVAVAGALVWKLMGSPVVLVVGVPLMIWSRVLLRRHTPAQTLAGSVVGVLLVVLFFDLFAGAV